MNIELFILAHKALDYNIPSSFKLLQLGKRLTDITLFDLNDATGDSISEKNMFFLETTGIYWIWKNIAADIKGNMQYRRFLDVKNLDICDILKDHDIILAKPFNFGNMSIYMQYSLWHSEEDIRMLKNIINELYPEYVKSFVRYIEYGNTIYYSNSFICSSTTYSKICKFCFDILFEFMKRCNYDDDKILYEHAKHICDTNTFPYMNKDIKYQMHIGGALFERLLTLYVLHNRLDIYDCGEYILKEKNMEI